MSGDSFSEVPFPSRTNAFLFPFFAKTIVRKGVLARSESSYYSSPSPPSRFSDHAISVNQIFEYFSRRNFPSSQLLFYSCNRCYQSFVASTRDSVISTTPLVKRKSAKKTVSSVPLLTHGHLMRRLFL